MVGVSQPPLSLKNFARRSLLVVSLVIARDVAAQRSGGTTLGMDGNGIALGNVPRVNGIRLNFRDSRLREVNGLNATIWTPYGEPRGEVNGIALGLPATGAGRITGITAALVGAGASESIRGVGVAPVGIGSGQELFGLMVGGVGVGTGGTFTGIGVGGVGVGSGGGLRGLMIGGFGVGSGGDISGMSFGGFGVGGGGDITGVQMSLIGVGGGGDIRGISFGGVGIGGGGDITGLQMSVVGIGSGGTLKGLSIGGVGLGASRLRGIAIGSAVGGEDIVAGVVAPVYFKVVRGGYFNGVALSSFNHVVGEQRGITIGILNYARRLRGVQIGALNYARDNPPGLRLLPIINFHMGPR